MKKFLALLLGTLLCIIPLTGCKEKGSSKDTTYFARVENEWVFKTAEREETVASLNDVIALTVSVRDGFSSVSVAPLYLYWDDASVMEFILAEVFAEKTPMQTIENMKGAEINLSIYNVLGGVKTVWIGTDGRLIYQAEDNQYYTSTKDTLLYQTLVGYCSSLKREYPHALVRSESKIVLQPKDGETTEVEILGSDCVQMKRMIDSFYATAQTQLQKEMLLDCLRLREDKTLYLRQTSARPLGYNTIAIDIYVGSEVYFIYVLQEGAIAFNQYGSADYYISDIGVVNYDLIANLYDEWF